MANWLDKARGRQASKADSAPFQLECDCGSRLSGMRVDRAKRVLCSHCGASHFILPVNQYPESERAHFRMAAPATQKPETVEAQLIEEEEERTHSDLNRGIIESLAEGESSDRAVKPNPDDEFGDIESDLQGDSAVALDEEDWQPRRRKPKAKKQTGQREEIDLPLPKNPRRFLPVLLAFGVLGAGMVFWLTSSRARDEAEVELKEAMDKAEAEFFDGNYSQAFRALQRAENALQVLGVTDDRADRVRQMKRHAEASTHLLDGSILKLVETASVVIKESGQSAWRQDFSVKYERHWFVMQVRVPSGVTPRSRLSFDWTVDERPILMDGLGTIAAWAKNKGELSEMIFAARLKGCRIDSKAGDAWLVEFDPETAFLWTDETSLIRQNMIPDFDDSIAARMRTIVHRQLEIGDAPPPPPPLEEEEEKPKKIKKNEDEETKDDSDET